MTPTVGLSLNYCSKALVAVEAEVDTPQGKPALPEYATMFSLSRQ